MKFTSIGTHVLCSFERLKVMACVQMTNFRVLRSSLASVYQEQKILNIKVKVKLLCPRRKYGHSFTHS